MCIICECKRTGKSLEGLKRISCEGCPNLSSIPIIEGLLKLNCGRCPNLSSIPIIKGLKTLYCSDCPNLEYIPIIDGLIKLYCEGCPKLKYIPIIKDLKEIRCRNCPNLENISIIEGLKELYCGRCPKIKYIPTIKELELLNCSYCRLLLTIPPEVKIIIEDDYSIRYYSTNPWIRQNEFFDDNLKNLLKIQKVMKKCLFLKRLKKYVGSSQFNDWYYSAGGPGGKNAIRRLIARSTAGGFV